MKSGREARLSLGVDPSSEICPNESSFVPCTFRLLQSGALTQVAVSQGGMHRSGVKAMGRNRRELNARCSHADIGRGLGRVRYVAERYRLLAQDRVRLILQGAIISDED